MKTASLVLLGIIGVLDLACILFSMGILSNSSVGIEKLGAGLMILACIPLTLQSFLLFRKYK